MEHKNFSYLTDAFMNFTSKRGQERVHCASCKRLQQCTVSNLTGAKKVSEKQENEKIAALEKRITKVEANLKKAQTKRGYRK